MTLGSLRQPLVLTTITLSLLLLLGVPTLIILNNKAKRAYPSPNIIQSAAPPSAQQTSPAADIVEPAQITSKDEVGLRGAFDRRRERDQNNRRRMDRESISDELRQDTAQGDAPSAVPPPKITTQSEMKTNETAQAANTKQTLADGQTIKVVLRIEGGRVTRATVGSSRPGMEAYESVMEYRAVPRLIILVAAF